MALPFTADEYLTRVQRVAAHISDQGLSALLVTSPENITYLTGYETAGYHIFQCLIVLPDATACFVLRNTEVVNVPGHAWLGETEKIQVVELADPSVPLLRALRRVCPGAQRIGFEDRGLFLPPRVVLDLGANLSGAELVPASGLVETERATKSPAEIALIRQATQIAVRAVEAARDAMHDARTDSDVAAAVMACLARNGSEYTGSPAYVVAAHASLMTHASHAMRPIGNNEHVWVEICASQHRYHGVLSRIVGRGTPAPEVTRLFDLSRTALETMIAQGGPGMTSGEFDKIGRSVVEAVVAPSYWPNRAGYGMGISYPPGLGEGAVMDIHEGDPRVLKPGMLFHLLPIMKSPQVGAVGCTETILITENGCESLVDLERKPLYV